MMIKTCYVMNFLFEHLDDSCIHEYANII